MSWAQRYTAHQIAKGHNPAHAEEMAAPDYRPPCPDRDAWNVRVGDYLRSYGCPEESIAGATVSRLAGNLCNVHRMSPKQAAETLDGDGAECPRFACEECEDTDTIPHPSRDPQREQRCPACGGGR